LSLIETEIVKPVLGNSQAASASASANFFIGPVP